jgi:hypothetical protein
VGGGGAGGGEACGRGEGWGWGRGWGTGTAYVELQEKLNLQVGVDTAQLWCGGREGGAWVVVVLVVERPAVGGRGGVGVGVGERGRLTLSCSRRSTCSWVWTQLSCGVRGLRGTHAKVFLYAGVILWHWILQTWSLQHVYLLTLDAATRFCSAGQPLPVLQLRC